MPAQTGLMLSSEMLNDLLSAGILTQSEYDAISALQTSQQGMGNPPSGGPGGAPQNITANTEIQSAAELTGGVYASEASDENALLIDTDEAVTLTDPTVTKTGDSDGGDSRSFYGLNAAVLLKGGANVTITGARSPPTRAAQTACSPMVETAGRTARTATAPPSPFPAPRSSPPATAPAAS